MRKRPSASLLSTASAQATDTSSFVNGIDIASFQHPCPAASPNCVFPNGDPINWTDVKNAGYQFAAIKATEGNYYTNPYYAGDAAAAAAAGMYVSAYEFANPNTANGTGTVQAQYAYTNAGNYKVGGQHLPLMLDIEYNPYASDGNTCYNLSPAQMVTWISQFVTETQALTGAPPIIYTPPSWWDECTGSSTAFGGEVLWVPSYSTNAPTMLPTGWNNWNLWQYTSVGTVPGITGDVDLDYFAGAPDQQTAFNTAVSLQIQTLNALAGQSVTYSATGLPPGLTMSSAGLVTGTTTAAAGVYPVTVTPTASSAAQPPTISFNWFVGPAPAAAVGAQGGNGQLYVQAPQLASGWQSLGGQIEGAPAVTSAPNPDGTTPASPVFFATGSNGEMWMRTLTLGWQPVGPAEAFCIGSPAAVLASNGTLTVACEGLNRQLYYNTTTMPSSGLPTFTSGWTSLGGILSAGPAVAPVGGVVTFFAEGTNGEVFTNTGSGFTATPWFCVGTLAAATQATTGDATFGCQGQGDHSLWMATNDGPGWSAAVSLGGRLSGGPGIAATSQQVEFFAEGSDGTGWEWNPVSGWVSIGGIVSGGTGASALN